MSDLKHDSNEFKANLKNKLQAPLSLLEALAQGKTATRALIKTALKDLITVKHLISGDK